MMTMLSIIYILVFIIFTLISYSIMQIKLAGLNIKDFWSFIQANELLDKLYKFARTYEKLNSCEQVIFLSQAEQVFKAFDKIPNIYWEEEYRKYSTVLDKYKEIRVLRWEAN